MTTDVVIKISQGGYYDVEFDSLGDLRTAQALDTAILTSILAEVRALPSEAPESNRRRGWIGNESTQGVEMGSKLWLFEQSRITGTALAEMGVIINNSLQWLITEAALVSTSVRVFLRGGSVQAEITLFRASAAVEKRYFELWNNTGKNT